MACFPSLTLRASWMPNSLLERYSLAPLVDRRIAAELFLVGEGGRSGRQFFLLIRSRVSTKPMPTAALPKAIKSVELDWYAEDDVVHVTPRNQKRFEIQKDRAIEILQRAKDGERFQQQFGLLLDRLAEWINKHQVKIENSILTLQDDRLAFVVVRHEARYDEQLQDDLADFDFDIANDPDLDLVRLKTLALPNVAGESLRSFLDERLVLVYHGDGKRPHQPGEP
jgi:hypothetical protein